MQKLNEEYKFSLWIEQDITLNIKSVLMRLIKPAGIIMLIFAILFIVAIIGISILLAPPDPIVYNDMDKLRKSVIMDISATGVTWEVVEYPDYTAHWLPPQEVSHYALLANFTVTNSDWFDQLENKSSKVWLSPSIARSWVPKPFHQMLQQHKGDSVEVSELGNCKAYETTMIAPNGKHKITDGFVCLHKNQLILYLTMYASTNESAGTQE